MDLSGITLEKLQFRLEKSEQVKPQQVDPSELGPNAMISRSNAVAVWVRLTFTSQLDIMDMRLNGKNNAVE